MDMNMRHGTHNANIRPRREHQDVTNQKVGIPRYDNTNMDVFTHVVYIMCIKTHNRYDMFSNVERKKTLII